VSHVAREKFEFAVLAGGALVDAVGTRLRGTPADSAESVEAAMQALDQAFRQHAHRLADPAAARQQVLAIGEELRVRRPRRMLLAGYVAELAVQVRPVSELASAVEQLRRDISRYLRWRLGPWQLS
jgi:multidrug efflux pump subunit AcrA (membrane-fusion protein)